MAEDTPLLRQPEFRRFLLSRLAGTAASQMLMVALALAAASAAGGLGRGALLVVSVVLGALRAYPMPASQALLPLLVPTPQWLRAMALASSALQVAIIGGPALGGLAYAGGASLVYALTAGSFAIALACCAGHRRWACWACR